MLLIPLSTTRSGTILYLHTIFYHNTLADRRAMQEAPPPRTTSYSRCNKVATPRLSANPRRACSALFRALLGGRVAKSISAFNAGRTGHDFQVHVTRRARIGEIGADWSNAGHLEASIPAASQHPKPTSSHRVFGNPLPLWTPLCFSRFASVLQAASLIMAGCSSALELRWRL